MIVLKKNAKQPDPVWVTYGESIGQGDGKTRKFPLPDDVTSEYANGLQILVNGNVRSEDFERAVEFDDDGNVTKRVPSGWEVLAEAVGEETKLFVEFDEAPRYGDALTVSVIGRKVENCLGFNLVPMVRSVQDDFTKRHAEISKQLGEVGAGRKKLADLDDAKLKKFFDDVFVTLVRDWTGVQDENGGAMPCDDVNKLLFISQMDTATFGFWTSNRSSDVRRFLFAKVEANSKN